MKYNIEIHFINESSIVYLPNVIGVCIIDDVIVIYTDDRCVRRYNMIDIKKIITEVNI